MTTPSSGIPRTRRPRGSITRESIIEAGLELGSTRGLDEVSMRNVAAAIGAAPMALYRHFPTKEHLVDALLDQVLGRIRFEPDTSAPWPDEFVRLFIAHRDTLIADGWAVPGLIRRPNPGVNAALFGERAFAIAARGDASTHLSVMLFTTAIAFNYGFAAFVMSPSQRGETPQSRAEVATAIRSLDPQWFPHTVAVATDLADYGRLEDHVEGLTALVIGLTATR